jgi:hypothetical protein
MSLPRPRFVWVLQCLWLLVLATAAGAQSSNHSEPDPSPRFDD